MQIKKCRYSTKIEFPSSHMLRPLPKLDDDAAMMKLGRLSAIRSARLDALHDLRDVVTRLLSGSSSNEAADTLLARELLDRIDALNRLST